MSTLNIGELLATCESAAAAAVKVIQQVQSARSGTGGEGVLGTTLKDADDPKSALTVADTAAQKAVMQVLRSSWPNLCIIGEESDDEEAEKESLQQESPARVGGTAPVVKLSGLEAPENLKAVREEAVVVFVDPLDGTREFVEGRLDAVQTLIGVSVYGRAVAGAIGLPFFGDWQQEGEVKVVSGIVGAGVAGVPLAKRASSMSQIVLTASAGQPKGLLADVASSLSADEVLPLGGVGNKVLALLRGDADIALMHLGTSLWDTCATEGVLAAAGGIMTDLHGSPLQHTALSPTINRLGVLASAGSLANGPRSHKEICADLRQSGMLLPMLEKQEGLVARSLGEPQATDIARDLTGQPLTAMELSEALGHHIVSYDAPEASACRFMMSEAVRLRLSSPSEGCPDSLFYKRVVMGELDHARLKAITAPTKLARDVQSYQVEAGFLGSAACADLVYQGVRLPRPYAVKLQPVPESAIDSRFSMLLEDFPSKAGWRQSSFLDSTELRSALDTIAQFHAFFWTGSKVLQDKACARELESAVWPRGSYYQPAMQGPGHMDNVKPGWDQFCSAFGDQLHTLEAQGVEVSSFGDRLAEAAPVAAAVLHEANFDSDDKYRTLIHGDLKSANIFLRGGQKEGVEAALIDFQWTGWGLAGTDVAYLIASSADAGLLPLDGSGETLLLRQYYDRLTAALVQFGVAHDPQAVFPFEVLLQQYEAALVDLCRLATAYQWQRIKATPQVLENNSSSIGRVAYNKSVHHALWLIVRSDSIMRLGLLTSA